ncbi:Uu.00g091040.m01.CDS01 [Anthostomella pinea]|uniref:Uu.00g091040.m01.CDS01 n=1 Tax=Anthostomella pinea TaxID=933095 RepID=A0AAI8VN36_9PEZI|nr:Uu.00g091040.m01.CDS01 [Anthostomella pinea]
MPVVKEDHDIPVESDAGHVVDGTSRSLASESFLAHLLQIPCLIWAFTESNFITFVLPNTAFGVLGALAGPELLQNAAGAGRLTSATMLWPTLLAMAFNWTNVLIFDLQNQTAPQSLAEDQANKPWRPIPSGRITTQQARRSILVAIPLCLALNRLLGVEWEGLYIQIGSYVYNDLRGGDSRARDLLIAIAFALFNTASLRIAAGAGRADILLAPRPHDLAEGLPGRPAPPLQLSPAGCAWIGLISIVILTTMQVQDLKDQAGDRLKDRWTVPLAFGDWTSRVSLALLVPFWTGVCAYVWWPHGHWILVLPPVLIGALVTFRVLVKRTPKADSNTWKLWCLWGVGLYYLAPASLI